MSDETCCLLGLECEDADAIYVKLCDWVEAIPDEVGFASIMSALLRFAVDFTNGSELNPEEREEIVTTFQHATGAIAAPGQDGFDRPAERLH